MTALNLSALQYYSNEVIVQHFYKSNFVKACQSRKVLSL